MLALETPRLTIRDLVDADLAPFFQLGSDPEVTHFQDYIQVENVVEARNWLQNAISVNEEAPRKGYYQAILRKTDLEWVGWIGFGVSDKPSIAEFEIGCAIVKKFWGVGYAPEAISRVIDYCFQELAISKIFGECDQENFRSERVLKKSGLLWETSYQDIDEISNEAHTMQCYSLTSQQWKAKSFSKLA